MSVNVFVDNDVLNAKVEGKLDSVTSPDFEKEIMKNLTENIKTISLDFEKVDFISSKALRVLVSFYKTSPSRNVKLINPNAMVLEVLKLSGLTKVFEIETK